jgi:4-hydroxy-4-methyl-2-oxoglutarate aldolase
MTKVLTPQQIEALRAIDTPTVCNAIERFNVRGRVEGFMGMDIRCFTPELGTMVGYAVTVTVDSTTPDVPAPPGSWRAWMEAMDASPEPVVLVFRDVGSNIEKSAHIGEVMGTIATRLGAIGIVCDGGIRDIVELKALKFHAFARGLAPAHGNPRLIEVNVPVVIDGVPVQPGDLIHGDANGVTTIPLTVADQIADAAVQVRIAEADVMAYIKSPDFTVEGFMQRRSPGPRH